MPATTAAHDIADRLRGYAARLEREVRTVSTEVPTSPRVPRASRTRDVIQTWGTLAGEAIDEAFRRGVLAWEQYEKLRSDEQKRNRDVADWHYRLFLATTSNIAMSDADGEGVAIPGFLCSRCDGWGSCRVSETRGGPPDCIEAIRKVADLVEKAN